MSVILSRKGAFDWEMCRWRFGSTGRGGDSSSRNEMAFIANNPQAAQHIAPRDLCNCRSSLSLEAMFLDEKDFMIVIS